MSQRVVVKDKKRIPSKVFIETKKPFECLIGCRANHLQQCPVCLSWHRITSSLLFGKLLILDQLMFVLFSFMFGQEMYQISSLHYWWWSSRTFIPFMVLLFSRIYSISHSAIYCQNFKSTLILEKWTSTFVSWKLFYIQKFLQKRLSFFATKGNSYTGLISPLLWWFQSRLIWLRYLT